MNTLSKGNSIALAIALGFSMLATSTSLNAQSSDRDDSGSERVTTVTDAKPAAKPTISFSESLKKKVAEQKTVKAAPLAKTPSNAKVATVTPTPAKVVAVSALPNQKVNTVQPTKSNATLVTESNRSKNVVVNTSVKTEVVKNTPVNTKAVVAPVPVASVKYENASPGRTPKADAHPKPSAPVQIVTTIDESITHDAKGSLIRGPQSDSKK